MASEIRIQPESMQLVRGQKVQVPITVVLDKPTKVRGIHASFWGAEETKATYTTSTTDSKGHVKTQTHTAIQHTDVVKQESVLSGNDKLGFFGNISDAFSTMFGGGKNELLQPGEYPFQVEIAVPENAPPTHAGKNSRIFYELTVQVDVPLGFDLKATQSFEVAPLPVEAVDPQPARTRFPEDEGRGFFSSMFSPDVKIEMAITADRFNIGDPIDGMFIVDVVKPLKCSAIRVRLAGLENTTAHSHNEQHWHLSQPVEIARPNVIDQRMTQEFSLPAVPPGPVSSKGHLYSIEWFVQVELDVPWAKDPAVRVPIVILGEASGVSP